MFLASGTAQIALLRSNLQPLWAGLPVAAGLLGLSSLGLCAYVRRQPQDKPRASLQKAAQIGACTPLHPDLQEFFFDQVP